MNRYPAWIPALSVLLTLSIYALGVYLLSGFGPLIVALYIIYCLWFEYREFSRSCRNCYYYGKLCGLGRGLIAPLFVKKGGPQKFTNREISGKDLIPDMLVLLFPLLGGIIYLFINFNFLTLASTAAIVILGLPCVGFMRSCLLCPNCKQRALGCPAQKFFGKTKQ
jgi:hypothetical protein